MKNSKRLWRNNRERTDDKTSVRSYFLFLAALLGVWAVQFQSHSHAAAQQVEVTPTYDPLAEPPLSPNPSELEFGRNRYWHWCMTCHGDRGQGLTDEFRAVWPEDHQNCWDRGCHTGHVDDEGFPIPKVVPAIVGKSHLVQFASVQVFADYLKATHPPQSPGVLTDEEYHAIALFVFTMNGRMETLLAVPDSTPTSTPTQPSAAIATPSVAPTVASVSLILLAVFVFLFLLVRGIVKRQNQIPPSKDTGA